MSCYHRHDPHGCDWPPPPDRYDAYGYPARRYRDDDAQVTAATLQSRAAALRAELARIEEDLETRSAAQGPDTQT